MPLPTALHTGEVDFGTLSGLFDFLGISARRRGYYFWDNWSPKIVIFNFRENS
jgi:hypothetical protein